MSVATRSDVEERLSVLEAVPDTPALVLDADVMRVNIERMAHAARVNGKDLRPHAKTHKIPGIGRLQLEAGAVGLQVAKLGEAEVFAEAGASDILVGYPIVGAAKLARLLDLAERIRISTSLDSDEVAGPLGRAATDRGLAIDVMLEIDTGLHRVGVAPGAAADLASRVADIAGVRVQGVLTHQGQAYSAASEAELADADAAACRMMVEAAESIRARGIDCLVVSVGSSATARFDARADGITELRPGTYVFNDATQVGHRAATWDEVAVWVVATVVSRPAPDRAVVDAGTKVLSADPLHHGGAALTFGRLMGRPSLALIQASEEHGVVGLPPGSDLRIGERVAIVPNHICPVVNLADDILVAEGGRIIDRWPIAARGKVR